MQKRREEEQNRTEAGDEERSALANEEKPNVQFRSPSRYHIDVIGGKVKFILDFGVFSTKIFTFCTISREISGCFLGDFAVFLHEIPPEFAADFHPLLFFRQIIRRLTKFFQFDDFTGLCIHQYKTTYYVNLPLLVLRGSYTKLDDDVIT